MKACDRCTRLPDAFPDAGTLYLAPPEAATAFRLRSALTTVGAAFDEDEHGIFRAEIAGDTLTMLCRDHFTALNSLELRDTRCLLLPAGAGITVRDFANTKPLAAIVALARSEIFTSLLRDKRLTSFFQPIVDAQNPASVFAYECLLRGKDESGKLIFPGELFSLARDAEMLFQLDRAARITAIETAAKCGVNSGLFINFNPTAIYDPTYCLNTTVAAMRIAGLTPEQIVFEVVESDDVRDKGHLLDILKFYRKHGFRVALDDLGAGYSSLNLLHRLQPDFIKLDMDLIRGIDQEEFKGRITANLLSLARDLNITTIAEGVETAGEWAWLKDHGADLVQGYLFARPAPEPPVPSIPA